MKGRPRTPYEIKELRGTLNTTRDKKPAQISAIVLTMDPPPELNEWGAAYWIEVMNDFGPTGLITKIDLGAFKTCCWWFGKMCEAQDIVDGKGMEIEKNIYNKDGDIVAVESEPNPMLREAERCTKIYAGFCTKFGLTPTDRTRLSVPKQKEGDKFDKFDS